MHAHHEHAHGGHSHSHGVPETGRAFALAVVLNGGFVLAEFAAGFFYGSMGLLADAGHNLGDVGGLLISATAFMLARKRRAAHYTYGFRKATVLASLLNAVILFLAVGMIVLECVRKFWEPTPLGGIAVMITAGVGILVNGATVLLFARERNRDLNLKSAYLHMLADTLVSVGVVLSGAVIYATGWSLVDPLVGLAIAGAILGSAWGLLRASVRLSMDGVPEGGDIDALRCRLHGVAGVCGVHHLHVWPISTTENALTCHIVVADFSDLEGIKNALRAESISAGIAHTTWEFERRDVACADRALA